MNTQCSKFRDHFLQEDLWDNLTPAQQDHLNECADCRAFVEETRHALNFLQEKKSVNIPAKISKKLQHRLFKPRNVFRPAYVFTMIILFISCSVFFIKEFYKVYPERKSGLLTVESVRVNGKPCDIYLDQNEKYVNIFIPYKGE